jgi:hypothetical protein
VEALVSIKTADKGTAEKRLMAPRTLPVSQVRGGEIVAEKRQCKYEAGKKEEVPEL